MPKPSRLHQFLLLPENRSANRALESAAQCLKQSNSHQIFLYGPTGTGKSHLISDAVRDYQQLKPKLKYEMLTSSDFAARLADASEAGTISQFQSEFRSLDLFILEDLQSIQKRKQTQQQLIHCLDQLESQGALVILSATTLPGSWKRVDRRLVDRCRSGLSIEVPLPSAVSRVKLCQHFAQSIHEPMPKKVAELIAREIPGSPRDLKSQIDRLVDDAHHRQRKLSVDYVEQYLAAEESTPEPSIKKVIRATAKYFDLKVKDIKSSSRRSDIVFARQSAMFLLRELTSHTQLEIAAALGKADHTAVIRACRKLTQAIERDARVRQEISELRTAIKSL